ncbi:MAG: ester cyclase [Thermoleophilia bacterium]
MAPETWTDRLVAAYSSGTAAQVGTLYTADCLRVEHAAPGAELRGRDGVVQQLTGYMHAVPDARLTVHRVVTEGAVRVVEWTFAGTHTGDLPGLPATNRPVALHGVSICDMDGEQIREEQNYFDSSPLLGSV